jgi:AmiR/NasT family two-component response regulator
MILFYMSRVLLIDNEVKSIEEIKVILLGLDAQCTIETYTSFQNFEKAASTANSDFFVFNLIVMEYQILKFNEWETKLNDLRSKVPAETVICFTAYDAPGVGRKHMLNLAVFNVLYKPYDKLILKESLNMALKTSENGKEEIKPVEMKPQESKALVGILKEVDIVSLSDLGFITENDAPIPLYTFSKYYSKIFSHEKKQSIWAQCIQSELAPNRPGVYINKFHFIGIEAPVLMKLRKHLQENKAQRVKTTVWSFADSPVERQLKIALVDASESQPQLKKNIEDNFKNVTVELLSYDPDKQAEPNASKYDCVINLNPILTPEALKAMFNPEIVPLLFTDIPVTDDKFKELIPTYRDIFRLPLDRSYFYKKLKTLLPDLRCAEPQDVINITSNEKIKAANLVKLSEICELYLIFSYHRELPKHSYREFAFITEDENQMIQLPAFCSFTKKGTPEPGNSGPTFDHQFTFWGTTDLYLKQIRVWLLHNYIEQNQGDSN